jgi:signal transduction histidine kinase
MTDPERLERRLERARRAREEAERIAEQATRVLYDRQRELELLATVAAAANEATDVGAALRVTLERVCAHMGWPVGHAYLARDGALVSSGAWHGEQVDPSSPFVRLTEDSTFAPGVGLPGRVLAEREPVWVSDLATEPTLPRAAAAREAGIHGALAFPIRAGAEIAGVLEFFTLDLAAPSAEQLALMDQVGTQLGRVVERELSAVELAARNDELVRSNQDLELFAYAASHDLIEPLRTVSGFVELLERRLGDRLDDAEREFVAYALDGVARMEALIDGLLAYSRIGRAPLEFKRFPAADAVRAALASLSALVERREAEVKVGRLPEVVGDRIQIERVLQNLMANAVKFVAPGVRPRVEVQGRADDRGAEISVSDNGVGLDGAQAGDAFALFTRLHPDVDGGGAGLGLAICRRVISRHGGEIDVQPRPGGGSVFRFTLPAARD